MYGEQEKAANLYGFETRDAMRHVGSVKIAAHGDDIRAAERQEVLCVREQVLNVRLCRVIVQKRFEVVETHKAAAVADDAELVIREVSRVLAVSK